MTADTQLIQRLARPPSLNWLRILFGLLFILVPTGACITSFLLPTLQTVLLSLQDARLLESQAEFIGLLNYTRLFSEPVFLQALLFTLLLAGARLLVVAVLPLVLGWAAGRLGQAPRLLLRLAFTLPVVVFAPVAIGVIWSLLLSPAAGFVGSPILANPGTARWGFLLIDSLHTAGLACALALIVYPAAVRAALADPSPGLKRHWPLAAAWLVGLIGTFALSLQDFSLSYILTQGGPLNTTTTLALLEFKQAFQFFNTGAAAALSVLLLLVLMLCGLLAGLVIVFSGLRLALLPQDRSAAPNATPILLGALALLILMPACVLSLLPVAWTVVEASRPLVGEVLLYDFPLSRILANTFLPLLGSIFLIQLPITYLGALGIGALRPLGRWSEALLLPFFPWLFVGIVPLAISAFMGVREASGLNLLPFLASPIWLNVPALVILALFFKGQEAAWREAAAQEALAGGKSGSAAFFRKLILPSLPLALLLGLAALFVGAGSLYWPLLIANQPELFPLPVVLAWLHNQYAMHGRLMAVVLVRLMLPVTVGFFVLFALFQIFFLDRLGLHHSDLPKKPATN
jgi:ABC-type sugar transport system permease subunit